MSLKITSDNFTSEVLESDKPVLVDFWASWCGPCRAVAPVIDELSGELTDVKVAKVNVDEEPEIAERYGIMSIPTLILFEKGQVKASQVGAGDKKSILEFIGK